MQTDTAATPALFGREEFIPQRIEAGQCVTCVGFADRAILHPRRLPRSGHNLWLAEYCPQLGDNGGLDLACRNATDRARPGAVLQHRLADVIAV